MGFIVGEGGYVWGWVTLETGAYKPLTSVGVWGLYFQFVHSG